MEAPRGDLGPRRAAGPGAAARAAEEVLHELRVPDPGAEDHSAAGQRPLQRLRPGGLRRGKKPPDPGVGQTVGFSDWRAEQQPWQTRWLVPVHVPYAQGRPGDRT